MLSRLIFQKFPSIIIITLAHNQVSNYLMAGEGNFIRAITSIEFKSFDDLEGLLREKTRGLRIILAGTGVSRKNDKIYISFLKTYFVIPYEGTFCVSMPPYQSEEFSFQGRENNELEVIPNLPENLEKFKNFFFKFLETDQIFVEGHESSKQKAEIA